MVACCRPPRLREGAALSAAVALAGGTRPGSAKAPGPRRRPSALFGLGCSAGCAVSRGRGTGLAGLAARSALRMPWLGVCSGDRAVAAPQAQAPLLAGGMLTVLEAQQRCWRLTVHSGLSFGKELLPSLPASQPLLRGNRPPVRSGVRTLQARSPVPIADRRLLLRQRLRLPTGDKWHLRGAGIIKYFSDHRDVNKIPRKRGRTQQHTGSPGRGWQAASPLT